MNILLFANYNETAISGYVFRNLLEMGHQVDFYSPDATTDNPSIKKCPTLLNVAQWIEKEELKPDLVLFVESSIHPLLTPVGLDQVKQTTAWWAIDNHMNYRWHKEQSALFDFSFFAMKDYVARTNQYTGKNNVRWLPLCADTSIHKDYELERTIPCGFVGNMSKGRKVFFDRVSKDFPIQIFSGKNPVEMSKIYSQCQSALNIAIREDLNMRVFETMACGTLLVTQQIKNGLTDLFEPGKHLLLHQIGNAGKIVRDIHQQPGLMKEIALNGMKEVHEHHTYKHRLTDILTTINGHQPQKVWGGPEHFRSYFVLNHRHFNHRQHAHIELGKANEHSRVLVAWFRVKEFATYIKNKLRLALTKKI